MTVLLKIISFTGLALTIVPSMFVFTQTISFEMHANLMVLGMILRFTAPPFWMKEKKL